MTERAIIEVFHASEQKNRNLWKAEVTYGVRVVTQRRVRRMKGKRSVVIPRICTIFHRIFIYEIWILSVSTPSYIEG